MLVAAEFFRPRRVHHLLNKMPLVLPFATSGDELGDWDPVAVLQLVLTHMVDELKTLFHSNSGKGGFEASWRAYQLELALEGVIYGHPLAPCNGQVSAALGTSTTRENVPHALEGHDWAGALQWCGVWVGPPSAVQLDKGCSPDVPDQTYLATV